MAAQVQICKGTHTQQVWGGVSLSGCQLIERRAKSGKQVGKPLSLSSGGGVLEIQITREEAWVWRPS